MKPLSSIRGVTFDAVGTLFFPSPSVGAIYSEVMENFGLKLAPNVLDAAFITSLRLAEKDWSIEDPNRREWDFWRSLVAKVVQDLAELPENFDDLFHTLWNEFAKGSRWELNSEALATFDFLESRGIKIALLTNWDSRVRNVVTDHNLDSRFCHLFISSEVGFEKPDPRIFEFASLEIGMQPRELLHVGDHLRQDYQGASDSRWHALLLSTSPDRKSNITVIRDLLEIREYV